MTAVATERNFLTQFFVSVYYYREYLKQSVARDLRNKYKRSFLGYFWTMLHPLGMMAVLAVVFSHIVKFPIENYAVFVFCGILPWNYLQGTVMMSLGTLRANANLFGQIAVPKYLFVLSIVLSNFVNLLLAMVPLLGIMLVFGTPISWTVLTLPIIALPLLLVVTGISLLLSAANVFYDDTLHLTEVALQAMYFMCPVLFGREMLPEWLVSVLVLNPIFNQIEFFRGIFYSAALPDPMLFGINLLGSFLTFLFCLWVFEKSEDKFLYFV